jgi:acyl-CoA thioester hydrolase
LSGPGIVTFTGVVHPWMCDAMGHLNVRHYVAMLDDASFQLLGHVAGKDADPARVGWADVRMEIDYLHETAAGALVTVHSHVEKIGTSSIAYAHALSGSIDGVLRARAKVVTVHFDLTARRKAALPDDMRLRAEALLAAG